jgi:uncharacterized protein with GYD domain
VPKYLIEANYTAEGFSGLMKDTASGRRDAVSKLMQTNGGKLEGFYFAFGADDVVLIADLPNNETAAAVAMTVSASGVVKLKTTPLLTVEEVDSALKKRVIYRAPGT